VYSQLKQLYAYSLFLSQISALKKLANSPVYRNLGGEGRR